MDIITPSPECTATPERPGHRSVPTPHLGGKRRPRVSRRLGRAARLHAQGRSFVLSARASATMREFPRTEPFVHTALDESAVVHGDRARAGASRSESFGVDGSTLLTANVANAKIIVRRPTQVVATTHLERNLASGAWRIALYVGKIRVAVKSPRLRSGDHRRHGAAVSCLTCQARTWPVEKMPMGLGLALLAIRRDRF